MGKRYVSTMVCVIFIVLYCFTQNANAQISDVSNHWAQGIIEDYIADGIISGYPDGTFKPDQSITRAEFITLINKNYNLNKSVEIKYIDVKATDWVYQQLAIAKAAGYIQGYEDATFRPQNNVTRQEMAVIIARLIQLAPASDKGELSNFKDNDLIATWSEQSLLAIVQAGYLKGYPDSTLKPNNPVTRAEAVSVLSRLPKDLNPVTGNIETPERTVISGSTISGSTIVSGSIVKPGTVTPIQETGDGYSLSKFVNASVFLLKPVKDVPEVNVCLYLSDVTNGLEQVASIFKVKASDLRNGSVILAVIDDDEERTFEYDESLPALVASWVSTSIDKDEQALSLIVYRK